MVIVILHEIAGVLQYVQKVNTSPGSNQSLQGQTMLNANGSDIHPLQLYSDDVLTR